MPDISPAFGNQHSGAQEFGDAPRLSDAAARVCGNSVSAISDTCPNPAWRSCWWKQAVIAPRAESRDGGRGEAAGAVRLQTLQPVRAAEVAAHAASELDRHGYSPFCWSSLPASPVHPV